MRVFYYNSTSPSVRCDFSAVAATAASTVVFFTFHYDHFFIPSFFLPLCLSLSLFLSFFLEFIQCASISPAYTSVFSFNRFQQSPWCFIISFHLMHTIINCYKRLPVAVAAIAIHLLIKIYKMYHFSPFRYHWSKRFRSKATEKTTAKRCEQYNTRDYGVQMNWKFINDNKKLIHLVVRYRCVCLCVCCLPHFSRLRPSSRSPSANLKRWLYFFVSPEIKWIFFRWSDLLHFEFPFYRLHSE